MFEALNFQYQSLLKRTTTEYTRPLFNNINLNSRLTGVVGARGVGKTTLLLQIIKLKLNPKESFYFSADHIYFQQKLLYSFVEDLAMNKAIKTVVIDEIHKYKNWSQELKNLYDGFPDLKIIFSGSSSLDITKGSHDLSRRALMHNMPGLSFREYLAISNKQTIQTISLADLLDNPIQFNQLFLEAPMLRPHFEEYLQQGFYPFYQEDPLSYHEKLLSIIEKTVFEDIANFYQLKTPNLNLFKKILLFLAGIKPGKFNLHNLAKNIGIDDKTASNYITYLEATGLINLIYPAEPGNQGLRRPTKAFLNNTNLMYALTGTIGSKIETGTLRELFLIQTMSASKNVITHSKTGDYQVNNYTLEVGGKNKTKKQIKGIEKSYIVKDDTLIASNREIPLLYFGFIY